MLPQLTVYAKILYLLMVVIFGALCREDHYVILSKCADDKTIHIAQDGKVSLTSDIAMTQNITIKDYMDWTAPAKTPNFTMFVDETQMYLCFNKHWRLVGMKERKDGCYFTDSMTLGYFEFHSASNPNKRIGFTYRGKPIGPKSNIHDENCYRFSKATPEEYFNRPLSATTANSSNRNSRHHHHNTGSLSRTNTGTSNNHNLNKSRSRNNSLSSHHTLHQSQHYSRHYNVNNDENEKRRNRQHHQQQILNETAISINQQQYELQNENSDQQHRHHHTVRHHHNDPRVIRRRQQHLTEQNLERSKHKQGNKNTNYSLITLGSATGTMKTITSVTNHGKENTEGVIIRRKSRKNRNKTQNGEISMVAAGSEKRTYLNHRDPTHRRSAMQEQSMQQDYATPVSTGNSESLTHTENINEHFYGTSKSSRNNGAIFSGTFLQDLQDEYSNDDASAINVLPNNLDSSTEYLFSNSNSKSNSRNSHKIQHVTSKKYLSSSNGISRTSTSSSKNGSRNILSTISNNNNNNNNNYNNYNNQKQITNNAYKLSSVASRIDVTNMNPYTRLYSSTPPQYTNNGGTFNVNRTTTKKYYIKPQSASIAASSYQSAFDVDDNIRAIDGITQTDNSNSNKLPTTNFGKVRNKLWLRKNLQQK